MRAVGEEGDEPRSRPRRLLLLALLVALLTLAGLLLLGHAPRLARAAQPKPTPRAAGLPCSRAMVQALGLDPIAAARAEKVGPCLPQALTLSGAIQGTITVALVESCTPDASNPVIPDAVFRAVVGSRAYAITTRFPTDAEQAAAPTPSPGGIDPFRLLVITSGADRWAATGGHLESEARHGQPTNGHMDFYLSRGTANGREVHIVGSWRCALTANTSGVVGYAATRDKIMPGPCPAPPRRQDGATTASRQPEVSRYV